MNRWGPLAIAVLVIGFALYILFGAEITSSAIAFLALAAAAAVGSFYLVRIPAQRRRQRALLNLAQLRASGVEIRNRGSHQMDESARMEWYSEVARWEEEVFRQAELVSPVEAESIRTLDTFPIRRVDSVTDGDAIHRISMLSTRLDRLNDLILRQMEND